MDVRLMSEKSPEIIIAKDSIVNKKCYVKMWSKKKNQIPKNVGILEKATFMPGGSA